jgi:hypothetical protein
MITSIIILLISLGIAIFICINLLKKVEKLEEMNYFKETYITKVSTAIHIADNKLQEIDQKGTFKGDDEIGWFFKNVLYIQELLNEFNLNKNDSRPNSNITYNPGNTTDPGNTTLPRSY